MPRTAAPPHRRGLAAAGGLTLLTRLAGAASPAPEAPARPASPSTEVVVHGEQVERGPRDATAASSVVRGEALAGAGTSSTDVLARVPGVEVARTGSSSDLATAAIRGATSAQTPVYLAGVRLNDDVTGTADLSTIPLFMLERVEVYRGNAPVDADRLGIGGAVFFEPRLPRRSELGAGAGVGSFGSRAGWVRGGVGSDRAATSVAFRREGADNDFTFVDDAGLRRRRTNADYAATSAWLASRYRLGRGARVTVLVNAHDREQGSPGLAVLPNPLARTRNTRLLGGVSAHLPCGGAEDGRERCALDLSAALIDATQVVSDPQRTLLGTPFVATNGRRTDEQVRLALSPSAAWRFGAAAALGQEELRVVRPSDVTVRAERLSVRPALTATWHATPDTALSGLAALECQGTSSPEQHSSPFDTPWPVGRLGASHRLGDAVELRGNVGRYVRVPTLGELYGVSAVVRGSPGLRPEQGRTVDAGVHVEGARGQLRATVDLFGFARDVADLVAYRQNVLGVVVPYNVGAARVLGAELAALVDVAGFSRATIAATVMDPRDTTPARTLANDILPFRTRLTTTALVEAYSDRGLPAIRLSAASAGVRLTHRSSRYADPAGLIVIPSQTVVDLEATGRFLARSLEARVALRNVGDARQMDTVGMPLPGRSVHATLEATWQ